MPRGLIELPLHARLDVEEPRPMLEHADERIAHADDREAAADFGRVEHLVRDAVPLRRYPRARHEVAVLGADHERAGPAQQGPLHGRRQLIPQLERALHERHV